MSIGASGSSLPAFDAAGCRTSTWPTRSRSRAGSAAARRSLGRKRPSSSPPTRPRSSGLRRRWPPPRRAGARVLTAVSFEARSRPPAPPPRLATSPREGLVARQRGRRTHGRLAFADPVRRRSSRWRRPLGAGVAVRCVGRRLPAALWPPRRRRAVPGRPLLRARVPQMQAALRAGLCRADVQEREGTLRRGQTWARGSSSPPPPPPPCTLVGVSAPPSSRRLRRRAAAPAATPPPSAAPIAAGPPPMRRFDELAVESPSRRSCSSRSPAAVPCFRRRASDTRGCGRREF